MIGTQLKNNDIWIYLTSQEISELENTHSIEGDYINIEESKLEKLTLKLNDNLKEMIDIGERKYYESQGNLEVTIYSRKLIQLHERGSISLHIGSAHIDINDISRLNGQDVLNYSSLLHMQKNPPQN